LPNRRCSSEQYKGKLCATNAGRFAGKPRAANGLTHRGVTRHQALERRLGGAPPFDRIPERLDVFVENVGERVKRLTEQAVWRDRLARAEV
jgi:hypothetical protein